MRALVAFAPQALLPYPLSEILSCHLLHAVGDRPPRACWHLRLRGDSNRCHVVAVYRLLNTSAWQRCSRPIAAAQSWALRQHTLLPLSSRSTPMYASRPNPPLAWPLPGLSSCRTDRASGNTLNFCCDFCHRLRMLGQAVLWRGMDLRSAGVSCREAGQRQASRCPLSSPRARGALGCW